MDNSPSSVAARHPGLPGSTHASLLGRYLVLARALNAFARRRLPSPSLPADAVPTLLISLPNSEERRRLLFSRLDRERWRLSSLPACYPSDPGALDDGEWERFRAMADRLRLGQRGCFLSHRRAWIRARESDARLTVVLEDDVVPLYEHPPRLPPLPRDLDLLHLHHFAQPIPTWGQLLWRFYCAPLASLLRPLTVHPIDEVLHSHCGRLRLAAMPGCAYAVTPTGADKLLALFDEVGNYDNWDAIVLRHAMSEPVHQRMLPDIQSDAIWFYRGQRPDRAWSKQASISLNAYAIYPPLFLHDHKAPSVKLTVTQPASPSARELRSYRTPPTSSGSAHAPDQAKKDEAEALTRTWLLCGIPRSGNGLCCRLADGLPDTVALSQPYHPRCEFDGIRFGSLPREPSGACGRLREFAARVRQQIREEGRAPSHQVGGGLYDNIMGAERDADSGLRERRGEWGSVAIDKPLSGHFTLFMSQPAVFSALLPGVAEHFGCFALVRNPLSLLASWQTVNLPFHRGRIAGAEPYDPELRRALDEEPDRVQRQLIILEWFFARYDAHLERRHVIRYEDLVESGGSLLFRRLGHERAEPASLKSRNESALYDGDVVETLLTALLDRGGAWTRFYRSSELEAGGGRYPAASPSRASHCVIDYPE